MKCPHCKKEIQTRTDSQNDALHVDLGLIAEKLNDAGETLQSVIRFDIPFTKENVKEYIWKPVQKRMYQKKSTTQLRKLGEIDKVHDVIMRELGIRTGIEYHPFPHDPNKQKEEVAPLKTNIEYPWHKQRPKF